MEIQLSITGLSHDGCGVGRTPDGKVVFVPGALPEETVSVSLGESKKGITNASLERVLTANPQRRTPPCPLAAFAAAAPS